MNIYGMHKRNKNMTESDQERIIPNFPGNWIEHRVWDRETHTYEEKEGEKNKNNIEN